ncbi:type VI secretion system tube protein Hcp [Erwiniaceae bacterium L1_54_6]|jgi:type VI secretion system secreted protein Hcp|uniref:Type VI secretion system tube protein Hcp n=1 Tax=Pantoea cypripedii TaxID=55209 RepID=A0A6B9G0Y0_PANCY|nr:type VI secretion system tube protein Hcp [Pantoea cypripedii]MDF7662333.1 type VI secretion system tube protein Hcp [Erwiniaceae bacterium L1_54_6]QGY31061.1 type VI secretion system tube protein Hcp [Pantoea cypripedii]
MSSSLFMRINGISGESQDADHKGWIDILYFDWGASQPGNMHTGGGGGAGKVSFKDLSVVAFIDRASPPLLKYCASGKHINKVEIACCKAGGTQMEYCLITLEDVLVTDINFSGSQGPDGIAMRYGFQAATINFSYWEQTASGGKGPQIYTGWNIKENCEI